MKLEFEGEYPRCFNSRVEYESWLEAARGSSPRAGFCTDCTDEYQAKMRRQKRCQYPEVRFYDWEMDKDGYFPNEYFHAKRLQGENGANKKQSANNAQATGYGAEAIRWAQEEEDKY